MLLPIAVRPAVASSCAAILNRANGNLDVMNNWGTKFLVFFWYSVNKKLPIDEAIVLDSGHDASLDSSFCFQALHLFMARYCDFANPNFPVVNISLCHSKMS